MSHCNFSALVSSLLLVPLRLLPQVREAADHGVLRGSAGCRSTELRGGEDTVDCGTVSSNCSIENCLPDFNKRISSKSSSWTVWALKARIEQFELDEGFQPNWSGARQMYKSINFRIPKFPLSFGRGPARWWSSSSLPRSGASSRTTAAAGTWDAWGWMGSLYAYFVYGLFFVSLNNLCLYLSFVLPEDGWMDGWMDGWRDWWIWWTDW